MTANGFRRFPSEKRTFRIPAEHDLGVSGVPHEHQGIELAIERTLFVDTAGSAVRFKSRAMEPFSIRIRGEGHLAALRIGKGGGRESMGDGSSDFFLSEVRTQHAVGVRKPAANVTGATCAAGDELRKVLGDSGHRRGLLRNQRHHKEFRRDGTF
jgi:hypothetical protein